MIKLFEEYNSYNIYHDELDVDRFIDITSSSIQHIVDKYPTSSIQTFNSNKASYRKLILSLIIPNGLMCIIIELQDEWYYVLIKNKTYKCDQLYGLDQVLDTYMR